MCMSHDFIINKATAKVFGKHFGLVYLSCAWLVSKSQYVSRQSLKSTRVFLVIVCLQANAGMIPGFHPLQRLSLVQPSRFETYKWNPPNYFSTSYNASLFFCQLDAYVLYFNTFITFLYMFRALLCSSSGGQLY